MTSSREMEEELDLYFCSSYRTVYDRQRCVDDRRYFQRTDGSAKYDRTVRIEWGCCQGNKGVF